MARVLGKINSEWVTHPVLPSNYWMRVCTSSRPASTASSSGGSTRAVMFSPGRSCTLDGLAIYSTTVSAGGELRFGLYDSDGTGMRPASLITDYGSVVPVLNTMNTLTGLSEPLIGGHIYWILMAYQIASTAVRSVSGHTGANMAGPNPNDGMNCLTGAVATGALGGSFGSINTSTTAPDIYFRVT
jgi:hypothetical protein